MSDSLAGPSKPRMTHRQVLEALSGLLLGMFVSMLASTVVSTSLPVIIHDLDGNQTAFTWVVTATLLTTAISIGLFGGGLLVVRLADQSRAIYLDRVESQVFLTNDVSANDPTCDADPCKALRKTIEDRQDVPEAEVAHVGPAGLEPTTPAV